ncbi:MAG: hypothetical protein NC181_00435 [Clostridium sp.]|nr:hypothetical protein [Clostridium sp.]MCM1443868.1 hypothetical protein [Candidatus Amulumruptor caecigallinarius]
MNQSISYTFLLNIIITFILVSFAVLMGTISYAKAYRVNSKIANAIEVCEGYNECSKPEIDRIINNYGYQKFNVNCNKENAEDSSTYGICVYKNANDGDNKHYSYDIYTYMYFDFPLIKLIKIPVHAKTDRIYNFS